MDLRKSAQFFDRQEFDYYDFTAGAWVERAFKGQLKIADQFISMWNRATRKRMLSTQGENESLVTPVVRVSDSTDVYMVGTFQRDYASNSYYRLTANIQHVKDTAVVRRRAPTGPSDDPGWAVNAVVTTTFGDFELRSADEDQDRHIKNYGSFFLFLPSNTDLQRQDTVDVGRTTFMVREVYPDSGYICARATIQPDDRIDVVFVSVGTAVYDTATQTVTSTDTTYNVTGKIVPEENSDNENSLVITNRLKFMILKSWIGVPPKTNDKIIFNARTFVVQRISMNSLRTEYIIWAEA